MSYDRSVSADPHELRPETVLHLQMPQLRFGPDSTRELGFQLSDLGIEEGVYGLVVTDDVAAIYRDVLPNWEEQFAPAATGDTHVTSPDGVDMPGEIIISFLRDNFYV